MSKNRAQYLKNLNNIISTKWSQNFRFDIGSRRSSENHSLSLINSVVNFESASRNHIFTWTYIVSDSKINVTLKVENLKEQKLINFQISYWKRAWMEDVWRRLLQHSCKNSKQYVRAVPCKPLTCFKGWVEVENFAENVAISCHICSWCLQKP